MGGIGLPEDLSSMSRFVRASFVKLNSVSGDDEIVTLNYVIFKQKYDKILKKYGRDGR